MRFTFAFLARPDAEAFSFFGIHIFRVRPRFGRIHEGAAQVHAGRYRTQVRPAECRQDCADTSRGRLPYRIAVLAMPRSRFIFRWAADQTNELVPWRDVYLRFATRPVTDVRDPFHSLMFRLQRKALDAMAYEAGVPRVRHLLSSSRHSEPWRRPSLILDQRSHRLPASRSN